MNSGYPNPSQILPLFFKINRQARIRWTITQDSTAPNTTGWTWQLFVKRFAGARQNVINLTLGNGLRYEVYSDTILVADFSSLQTDLEEGEYYYELVRTDIETTWQEGTARFEFAKTSTSVIEESNFTINVDSNGSPITLAVASSQTINVNGITQAQLDTKQDKPTVVTGNTTAEIDAVYYVTASATFTDPTPVQGKGFTVFVRNGTATVGGTGYSTAGTIVKRVYHSGAWANYQIGAGGGSGDLLAANNLSDLADIPTARINLGIDNAFISLTDGATVNWDLLSKKFPQAKLTSTQSFTINMTNVLDGAQGVLKLTTNTASAITITFDTDFTNKTLNNTLTTYTFPAATGQQYFLSFVVDGTSIEWVIGDVTQYSNTRQWARVSRAASQSLTNNTITAISFDTESTDNASIYSSGNPTRLTIPGSGNKIATVSCTLVYASNSTGIRRIFVYRNGANVGEGYLLTTVPNSATSSDVQATFQVECAGGDYLEVMGQQTSGGALNVTAFVAIKIEDR